MPIIDERSLWHMTFKRLQIAARTPFFHGTTDAAPVLKSGMIRMANATPAGARLGPAAWFYASAKPALSYCYCEFDEHTPAVLEYETTRELSFVDLRALSRRELLELADRDPLMPRLERENFDGVVIDSTTDDLDYEYGFAAISSLRFVRFDIPSVSWHIENFGRENYYALSLEARERFHSELEQKNEKLRKRIDAFSSFEVGD
jgi:hypothetical protein